MHVPDGFLDVPTSVATATLATAVVGVALRRGPKVLDERLAPLAGLTAAYVFAVQMVNFPVGVGTSGHLMGGALVVALVGPWAGLLCMTVVIVVQALLFADGGLTALGTNVTLIAVTTVAVGWLVIRLVLALLPKKPGAVVPAAVLAAFVSVPAASGVFVLMFSVGGQVALPLDTLVASMLGWHALIGVGEAVITGLTLSAVMAARPDLVHAAPRAPVHGLPGEPSRPVAGRRLLVANGVAVIVLLAGVVSFFASSRPDGLEYVAAELGFLDTASEHALTDLAVADYGASGGIPVGVAGVAGVAVTIGVAWLVSRAVQPRHQPCRRADTVVHRLPAHVKLCSQVAFVVVVVATPAERYWTFAAYGALLVVAMALAGLTARSVMRRMAVEIPFVVFAGLMPFVAGGARVDVLGLSLSADGLLAGWSLLVKATLGVAASVLLVSTTDRQALLTGLRRLRLPARLVEIATFVVRYLDVVAGEMRRMRIARESRAFEARHLRHAAVVAHGAGALFVRTYERGERVHRAMLARGYTGSMPAPDVAPERPGPWVVAGLLPLAALVAAWAGGTWT